MYDFNLQALTFPILVAWRTVSKHEPDRHFYDVVAHKEQKAGKHSL